MPTPAYTELDSNKPDGSTSPTTYSGDDLANVRALRDIGMGLLAKGFVQSRTTGTGPDASRPQYVTWLNATLSVGFRWKLTWGGTGNWQITSIEVEWTNDNGGSWTSVRTAQANTLDASGNITSTTQSGGAWTVVLEIWGKCVKAVSDLAAHIAAHRHLGAWLGTIATQSAAAAALTGTSTLDGTGGVGQTTPPPVDATRVRESFHDYGAIGAGATVTLEWDKYSHFAFTPSSTTTDTMVLAFSGLPASGKSQTVLIEIINGRRSADGKITYPANAKWIGGSATRPLDTALELSGRNFLSVTTRDGGTRLEFSHQGKGG
jgi:hypothetical protein